jgi:hypothetical protein
MRVDPDESSTFLIAAYEGYISLPKNSQNAAHLMAGLGALVHYLNTKYFCAFSLWIAFRFANGDPLSGPSLANEPKPAKSCLRRHRIEMIRSH